MTVTSYSTILKMEMWNLIKGNPKELAEWTRTTFIAVMSQSSVDAHEEEQRR